MVGFHDLYQLKNNTAGLFLRFDAIKWHGSIIIMVRLAIHRSHFDSHSFHFHVTNLSKLFIHMCLGYQAV